ncbi:Crp/Fnr family transcriptional regulator [Leptolyngbya sp. NK1-12]|uniref:Crp/Fnr family transcriptional regulator n=1 Tax=Leptolyngbya sp. NK1-12 TaxID=2547451 RepID=A0AA96WMC7_9CYAN|nr:Crp/Fnr family transcriptional regulator [Leptolyngbya sp. NK1-12]WNZ27774.1 Crp/Fnr family transcriptional regulator [Leptolyngbya sp. NK1-12]
MLPRFNLDDLPADLKSQITRRSLTGKECLFLDGDPANYIYYVESGVIRLLHYTELGQTVNHYTLMSGNFLAEVLIVSDKYLCTAVVEEPAEVLAIPKQAFINALSQNPSLMMAFLGEVAYRLHMTKVMMQIRSIRSASERVLNYLRVTVPAGTNVIVLDRPLKEIAYNLDLTPESLSRALAQLQEERYISRERGRIILHR